MLIQPLLDSNLLAASARKISPTIRQQTNVESPLVSTTPNSQGTVASIVSEIDGHLLVLLSGCRLQCRACNATHAVGYKNKVKFGCYACKVGFHPQCFSAYHAPLQLKNAGMTKAYDTMSAVRRNVCALKRKRGGVGNNKFGGASKFEVIADVDFPYMCMETNDNETDKSIIS